MIELEYCVTSINYDLELGRIQFYKHRPQVLRAERVESEGRKMIYTVKGVIGLHP